MEFVGKFHDREIKGEGSDQQEEGVEEKSGLKSGKKETQLRIRMTFTKTKP